MSVLIKGMKMPKSCSDCFMHSCSIFTDHDTCMALKKDIWKLGVLVERLEDCPLVEVPTLHGPLVDGEDLWTILRIMTIDDQPTIIEAEEGEER